MNSSTVHAERRGFGLGVLLVLPLLSGCLDFTAAKLACFDAGGCKGESLDPPSVITTVPTNAKMNVGVNDALVITFSREMDPSTVTVQLTPPDGLAAAEFDDTKTTALFVPAAPLRYATQYTARVNGSDAQMRTAMKEHIFSFTTQGAPDMTAPTLVSSLPTSGAMNVPVTATLQLDFSEAMDRESLIIISNPPRDFGAPTWMGNSQTVRFLDAGTPLDPLTDYTLGIDARDVAGNPLAGSGTIVFTTAAPPDTSPPIVVSMSPPAGSTGISPNTDLSFSFSEPVKAMATSALSVSPPIANLTCALDFAGVLMTCNPPVDLAGDAGYTVRVRSGADGGTGRVEDLAGNVMAQDFVATFVTSAVPDTTRPTVVSFYPDAGQLGLPYTPLMRVTFSEPMDKAATQAALQVSSPNGVTGSYSWDVSGRTVTFTPTPPQGGFPHSTNFAWQVGTGARDLAGNTLMTTQQYTFRVRRQVTTTMTSLAADGYLRETGVTRTAYPSFAYTYVGDNFSNDAFKTFFYFDFAVSGGIPTNVLGIVTAQLELDIYARVGDPRGSLGTLVAESLPWASPFGASQWSSAAIQVPSCGFFCLNGYFLDDSVGRKTTYVTNHVTQALPARRIMFRLQYTKDEDNQSDSDYVAIRASEYTTASQRPQLQVTYEVP